MHRYINIREVDPLRDAAHDRPLRYDSLGRRLRDEVLVVLAIDFGLRANELRQLKEAMFRLDDAEVVLPGHIQKDYPREDITPGAVTMRLDPYGHFGTVRLLRTYFGSEWYRARGSDYVFPSRQSDVMSTESMRNVVRDLAVHADVTIHRSDGAPADPSELHPHAFRHSLANYMLADSDTRLVDVRNHLRHRSVTTTERVYDHFQRR
ncbi:integrase family protein [Candidatus Halobonum tyrrellensis G22]|uniref:Integrase family protein n=1 Tax=Candidatus Halobonum tyrrellensis G22 TaxID=1324957 RepID=V4HE31_9EURY|nr:integrase family protein [Candidatus Halobonum tyrrellensis G22]